MISQYQRYPERNGPVGQGTGADVGRLAARPMPEPANDVGAKQAPACFPAGTAAWIYRPAKSPSTAGTANVCHWVLQFEPTNKPSIDPLMGWYGGADTLQQVQLKFPSKEAAIAYACRHGLNFIVQDEARCASSRCPTERDVAAPSHWAVFQAMEAPAAALVDMDVALTNPARIFAGPWEVVAHPALTPDEKRQVLKRWEWDARLIEIAANEAMPDGEASRLSEVLHAIAALPGGDPQAAPAAAAANNNQASAAVPKAA